MIFWYTHRMNKPKVIAIVGPTASGKTSLSIALAQQFTGEIISADSRQVYQGLDIGSGKVTPDEMAGIPHHLLDIADPMTVYTGIDFVQDAEKALADILKREHTPIVVGGTFFYLDLLRGKVQAAPVLPNQAFRDSLEDLSNATLLKKLYAKDIDRAEKIDPHNRRRLVRALEITEALGTVPKPAETESPYEWLIIGIDIDKEWTSPSLFHHCLQWNIAPLRLMKGRDDSQLPVERTPNGCAHRRYLFVSCNGDYHAVERVNSILKAERCWFLNTGEDIPIAIRRRYHQLRAANIQTHIKRHDHVTSDKPFVLTVCPLLLNYGPLYRKVNNFSIKSIV